ncbi:MAG: choice-of-anchor J domain-containing protein [Bacteroidales bacterium]|nr:choice-of-anchor J domain-containing protein [Bacteroidales bacterium]
MMKSKKIGCVLTCIFVPFTILAQNVCVLFNGDPLTEYMNQQVTFGQTLHVCGHYSSSYGQTLYLSYERLRQAEEVAGVGTPLYDSLVCWNETAILTASCPEVYANGIRLGSTITNLVATVDGERHIHIDGVPVFAHNERPQQLPDLGDVRLVVCGANLEYYCPVWEDTYGAESDEQFALQHDKTMQALAFMGADIYALTEIQQGRVALDSIVNGLNQRTAPNRYAYVFDNDILTNTYTKVGFVYRTDKVRPVLRLGHPYSPAATPQQNTWGYYLREEVQAFEEIATGERFVLCMNHFKSKSGGDSTNLFYNADRMENAEYLVEFLSQELENNYYGDPDVLILGDLNCASAEEPIRFLESSGYINLLQNFSPSEYSYVFDDQVLYLDHALATPEMEQQVTGAAPFHVNADESYTFYYPYGLDSTMFRYSDHDPILVGLRLQSDDVSGCQPVEYNQSFNRSLGSFEAVNILGSNYWYCFSNYECAYINGYASGENEDWLISPTFDLTNKDSLMVEFTHTLGYGVQNQWRQHCKLLVSSNYNDDISTADWEEIPIPSMPSSSWSWQHNEVTLPAHYAGQEAVTLAFRYTVEAGNDIPAWEIKDFSFSARCVEDSVGIAHDNISKNDVHLFGCDGCLIFESDEMMDVAVYDLVGKEVASLHTARQLKLPLPTGIYIVKYGTSTGKVLVK